MTWTLEIHVLVNYEAHPGLFSELDLETYLHVFVTNII